jgi:hypothetical protein
MIRKGLKNKETLFLLLILVIAAFMRLWHYEGFSFSNDELSALYRTRFDTFNELVRDGFYVDGHPGGIQVFLFYWVRLFGLSEVTVRLPFVIAGCFSVWLTYLVAARWFNKVTGLFSAVAVGFFQYPLVFSQIARPYVTGLLFVLMMVYFWTRILFDSPGTKKTKLFWMTVFYTLSVTLCLYNHYFSFLFAVITGITGLFFLTKHNIRYYLAGNILSIILFIPHIPITLNHLRIGGVGLWLGKPGVGWLPDHLFHIFNSSYLVVVAVILIMAISILINLKKIRFTRFQIISIVWFLLPFIIGFIYSRAVNPVLLDSVLLFSFPFLIFFIFSFFGEPLNRLNLLLLVFWGLACLSSTVIEKDYYHSQHFGEFRDVAVNVAKWDKEYGADNITRAISVNNSWYIDYYLKQYNCNDRFEQYDNRGGMDLLELKHIVKGSLTPYFLYAWTKPTPLEIEDIIREQYPFIIQKINYDHLSEITLYGRHEPSNGMKPVQPVVEMSNDFEQPGKWGEDTTLVVTNPVHSGFHSYRFDSTVVYGPTFSRTFSQITLHRIRLIKVNVWVINPEPIRNVYLVLSIDAPDGKNMIWFSRNLEYFLDAGSWGQVFLDFEVPEIKSFGDRLKVYIWNDNHQEFYIDDFGIAFYE